jgi:hypothetical protein
MKVGYRRCEHGIAAVHWTPARFMLTNEIPFITNSKKAISLTMGLLNSGNMNVDLPGSRSRSLWIPM